jgi:hypothetical protein
VTIPPFPVELLARPDEAVGKALLGWWIGFQLERAGFDAKKLPREVAERLVEATQRLERDDIGTMPLARAVSLAASGEFERAGRMFRQIILDGGNQQVRDQAAAFGLKIRAQRREYSRKGNANKILDASARREKWRAAGTPIRAKNPGESDSWLARQIARLTGDNANSIRAAIPSLGLGKKTTQKS